MDGRKDILSCFERLDKVSMALVVERRLLRAGSVQAMHFFAQRDGVAEALCNIGWKDHTF